MRKHIFSAALLLSPHAVSAQELMGEAEFNRLLADTRRIEQEEAAKIDKHVSETLGKSGEYLRLLPEIVQHIQTRYNCERRGLLYLPGHPNRDAESCVAYVIQQALPAQPLSGSKHRR